MEPHSYVPGAKRKKGGEFTGLIYPIRSTVDMLCTHGLIVFI